MKFEHWRCGSALEEVVNNIISEQAEKFAHEMTRADFARMDAQMIRDNKRGYTPEAQGIFNKHRKKYIIDLYGMANKLFDFCKDGEDGG